MVQEGQLTAVAAVKQKSANRLDPTGEVSITTTSSYDSSERTVDITFSGLNGITGRENRLAIADHVVGLMGYSPDQIANMREETKLTYLNSDTLHAVSTFCYDDADGRTHYYSSMAELTADYPTEDSETDGSYRFSTLRYSKQSTGMWTVTLDSYYQSTSPMQTNLYFYPSIAV